MSKFGFAILSIFPIFQKESFLISRLYLLIILLPLVVLRQPKIESVLLLPLYYPSVIAMLIDYPSHYTPSFFSMHRGKVSMITLKKTRTPVVCS